ncbi:MAG: hypothetical protein IIW10_01335 [Spirochaetaceae bacterium]|nr:hypothetical protein [Spirochaetaceae bacterium]
MIDRDELKKNLLALEDAQTEFSIIYSGKKSKKVNGLYKPETAEIVLHTKNFGNDNALIYTAIHEYTHHLQHERGLVTSCRCHTGNFWAMFHELLAKAESTGFYKIGADEIPELVEITKEIREKYITGNADLMKDFAALLMRAQNICKENSVRYEDYIDRVLRIPRNSATAIVRVANSDLDSQLGFDNMKMLSRFPDNEKRRDVESMMLAGTGPVLAKKMMQAPRETDPRKELEREKSRIERSLNALSRRLEIVEEKLAAL